MADRLPEEPQQSLSGNKAIEEAAPTVGMSVIPAPVRTATEFEDAFTRIAQARADAVLVLSTPLYISAARSLADLAIRHRLPAMFHLREYAEAGGLMAYGPNAKDHYRHAATYVDKLLKGAKPADLPVEQAMRFELVINLKTAQALGLSIPPTLLFQANEVIQ